MTPHLGCVLCIKRVMAVQVYTVLSLFFSKTNHTYFLSKIADCISNRDVMLFVSNDDILHSEGGRSKKAKKLRSYLMYGP